jgi:hypothetical protein
MLWAMHNKPHSIFTFSIPLKVNLRNPQSCLILPKTLSASTPRRERIPAQSDCHMPFVSKDHWALFPRSQRLFAMLWVKSALDRSDKSLVMLRAVYALDDNQIFCFRNIKNEFISVYLRFIARKKTLAILLIYG